MSSLCGRMTAAIGALLIAALVSGCDEDGGPDSTPPRDSPRAPETSSSTEPPTTTLTETGPVEPTLPAKAAAPDQAGVEAFVTFYWDVVNYATKTGDVELLRRVDQPSCDTCDAAIDGIEQIYARGGKIVGGDYSVVRLEPAKSDDSHWTVVTHTTIETQRTVGAGSLNDKFPGGRTRWLMGVALVRGEWSVSTLERR